MFCNVAEGLCKNVAVGHVLLSSPELGIHTEARVVYCQRVEKKKYAIGPELLSPEKEWSKLN